MSFLESLRHKLSVLVLWCAFLVLYLGGAAMLAIGLFFASREWWVVIHQHASTWEISTKTVEVLVLGLGLLLVLILPVFHRRSVGRSGAWKAERQSKNQRRVSVAD
jgi:hypothetical protein